MNNSKPINFEKDIKYLKMDSFRLGKLPEIKNILLDLGLDIESEPWVLVEKIHGSNSGFVYQCQEGEPTYQLARRNGFVPPTELKSFFNIEKAYQPYLEKLNQLCESACYELGLDHRHHQVVVNCELYGADIQKGMNYHDTESILVFDIRVDNTFLSYEKVRTLCALHGLPVVPLIQQGTLDNLITSFQAQLEGFNSHVPQKIHGQPVTDAPAEGVILRPLLLDDIYDPKAVNSMVQRYKWKKMEHCERPKKKVVTEGEQTHLQALMEEAVGYINIQRLHTFKSKVGVECIMKKQNIGKNINELVKDTLVDIREESKFTSLLQNKKLFAELRKMISQTSARLIQTFQFEYMEPKPKVPMDEEQLAKIDRHISDTHRNLNEIRTRIQELQRRNSTLEK